MNERNHRINYIAVFLAISAALFSPVLAAGEKVLESRKYYIAGMDDPFFKIANDLEIIDSTILILENPRHHILAYEIDSNDVLKFKGFFVQKGQGPGETVLPTEISHWKDNAALIDSGSISFFSSQGKFLNKFRIFTGRISFVYAADKIYLASPNPNTPYLISVYSTQGKKLFQFGEDLVPVDFNAQHKRVRRAFIKSIFFKGKLLSDGHFVYYLNELFGTVFVFDLDGKKVKTGSFVHAFAPGEASEILKHNTKLLEDGIRPDKNNRIRVATDSFFLDAYLCGDKIYLLNSRKESMTNPHIKIRVFDKNSLKLADTLSIKKDHKDDWIRSFAVKEINGQGIIFAAINIDQGTAIARFSER